MKVAIPETLKKDVPENNFGKVLASTPVIMTVIATGLAGLASSEMTRAQYDRSMAAQMQAKAGDQWSFFQAKRLRGATQRASLEVINAVKNVAPFSAREFADWLKGEGAKIPSFATLAASASAADVEATLKSLEAQKILVAFTSRPLKPEVAALVAALEEGKSASELGNSMGSLEMTLIDEEISQALADSRALDQATKPQNDFMDAVAAAFSKAPSGAGPVRDAFTVARMQVAASRYEMESRLNQRVATLYELRVRKENTNAERHHRRSGRFFYGMLAAQLATIVSTMAMAAKKRNLLWSIAAVAGAVSIGVAAYVYLYI